MSPIASSPDAERVNAARLAHTLLRCASAAAHEYIGHTPPGHLKVGTEAFLFVPSWSPVPVTEVEAFLIALPSPVLLSSTLTRGTFNLVLVGDLNGDRRRWAEKTLSNGVACLDAMRAQLGLADTARVLVEFDDESHVFALPTLYYWAQHMAVDIGWNLDRLDAEPRADARMMLIRADGRAFPGRSSMLRPGWRRSSGDAA